MAISYRILLTGEVKQEEDKEGGSRYGVGSYLGSQKAWWRVIYASH